MSQVKQQLVQQLIDHLHSDAKKKGYVCAAIGEEGYRHISRMTSVQLQDELDRLNGVKKLEDMPANHVCVTLTMDAWEEIMNTSQERIAQ